MKLRLNLSLGVVALAACMAVGAAQAATMRWAGANDILTVDPHAQNHQTTHAFLQQIYEGLVRYDKNYQIQPALATKWTQISPTQVRFELRRGVKFHDGAPFTADDVVFSITRVMTPPSNMISSVQSVKEVKKVDDFTVDLILKGPNPVLLRELTEARIMNKAWAEKNNSVKAQDYAGKEENFASRNANGTGPFMLVGWQPDVKLTLKKNPNWWDKPAGNVDEVVFTPIKSAATRTAALISGQVDFVVDPPPQDLPRMKASPDLKLVEGAENRTIYLGLDQFRDELPGAGTPGKNPLKDKRVRQALYQAIDSAGIHSRTMRNLSVPAGTMVAPMVHGWTKQLDERASKYDVEAAKKLLADAGYPQGFALKLDCPNDRYVNDEAICQAVTAMWTRIGVKTTLQTAPMSQFVSRVMNNDVNAYLFGWGVATFDALYTLDSLMSTKDGKTAAGVYNGGRISDPKLDATINQIKVEMDAPKRDALINEALQRVKDEYYYLPLHHQIRPWAMRKGVDTPHRADDRPMPTWTTIN
ncbi:ABC transporter substrate-binding protein [Paracidovorax wautersii]|uniref:Peptide/nickel transport system substrate-binding protein n=1 Tax=Paracidovorax wautersii TaxID=1177982 RepID=A0A1I2AM89_9BURK|nr:ABC transporter substrate-binding protein [Paracidovorax wautersii]SFE45145.1 peptide/nickel transport system substrate-binding protein [Paracidovorax wautersii]